MGVGSCRKASPHLSMPSQALHLDYQDPAPDKFRTVDHNRLPLSHSPANYHIKYVNKHWFIWEICNYKRLGKFLVCYFFSERVLH